MVRMYRLLAHEVDAGGRSGEEGRLAEREPVDERGLADAGVADDYDFERGFQLFLGHL